jgi:hypothetical protein
MTFPFRFFALDRRRHRDLRLATRDQVIILAGIPWNPGTT